MSLTREGSNSTSAVSSEGNGLATGRGNNRHLQMIKDEVLKDLVLNSLLFLQQR